MIVYKVFGSEYDSWYEGNTYATRELAEAEAAALNKQHQEYSVCHEIIMQIESDYLEQLTQGLEYRTVEYDIAVGKIDTILGFLEYPRSESDVYVHVHEVEVLESLPDKFTPSGVDIHSAVINFFK